MNKHVNLNKGTIFKNEYTSQIQIVFRNSSGQNLNYIRQIFKIEFQVKESFHFFGTILGLFPEDG
jgi:hypothetical protein